MLSMLVHTDQVDFACEEVVVAEYCRVFKKTQLSVGNLIRNMKMPDGKALLTTIVAANARKGHARELIMNEIRKLWRS